MTKKELIKKLEDGEYTIEEDGACNCTAKITVNRIEYYGEECWFSRTLLAGGEEVYVYTQFQGGEMLADLDYLPSHVLDDVRIRDDEENPFHDPARLILSALEDLSDGTKFYRDNERGFANEYEIIIAGPDAAGDDINEDWDEIDVEEAAREIAYDGDAATQAYISYRFL